ncbi:MAG: class C sortase, partial [Clostridia bacterium]|nr:class C sortase [Clostridia bacterium]
MNWLKRHGTNILLVLALIFGLGLLVYPTFADYWNSFTQSRAIVSYAEAVANLDTEKYEAIWNDAVAYNQALSETGVVWLPDEEQLAEYERQLNVNGTGNMGYIDIPKINVSLPIYHGTTEAVLQTSIGHITGTSLPAGGEGSHCVLSGHRGLPSAKLFSDLDKLLEGDRFILTVLDQTLTYEVDQIRIVEPTDLSDLVIEEGMDYCTLVTCTPYGINTHRMLVRGHRVENERKVEIRITADAMQIDPVYVAPVIALPVLALLIIWMLVITSGRSRCKRAAQRRAAQQQKEARRREKNAKGKKGKGGKPSRKRPPEVPEPTAARRSGFTAAELNELFGDGLDGRRSRFTPEELDE